MAGTTNVIPIRFRVRTRTAEEWANNDEILLNKEVGYVSDMGYAYKIGNGISKFSELPFNISPTALKLTKAIDITIGNTSKSFDGSVALSWSLEEMGALPVTGGTITGDVTITNGMSIKFGEVGSITSTDDRLMIDAPITDINGAVVTRYEDGTKSQVQADKFVGNLEGDASTVCGYKIAILESVDELNGIEQDPNTIYFVRGNTIADNSIIIPSGTSQTVDDSAVIEAVTNKITTT